MAAFAFDDFSHSGLNASSVFSIMNRDHHLGTTTVPRSSSKLISLYNTQINPNTISCTKATIQGRSARKSSQGDPRGRDRTAPEGLANAIAPIPTLPQGTLYNAPKFPQKDQLGILLHQSDDQSNLPTHPLLATRTKKSKKPKKPPLKIPQFLNDSAGERRIPHNTKRTRRRRSAKKEKTTTTTPTRAKTRNPNQKTLAKETSRIKPRIRVVLGAVSF